MKKHQFYKYSSAILLLINIAILCFFLFARPKQHPHPPKPTGDFAKNAIEILQLNQAQSEIFKSSVDEHRHAMKTARDRQELLLRPYFNSLSNDEIDINIDSILNEVQLLERNKITATYKHFEEIKSALQPNQLNNFDNFIQEATKRVLLNSEKKRRPPKES